MPVTTTQADELTSAFASDGATVVIESLLRGGPTKATVPEERVLAVMQLLEEMAEHQIESACALMLSLWPMADNVMMHDVCDSIDLWVCNNRTPRVIEHVRNAAKSAANAGLKGHFNDLLPVTSDA